MVAMFGGSRALSERFSPLVAHVVSAVRHDGGSVSVGCACGADAAALRACLFGLASGCPVSLFAAFDPLGSGSWSGSAVSLVQLAATRPSVSVSWLAGGPLSVPLRSRLLGRSLAALAVSSCAVFFLSSPTSPGSLRVAAAAASRGLHVFAFCCGFSSPPAPLASCAGFWAHSSFFDFPCLTWLSTAKQPNLF